MSACYPRLGQNTPLVQKREKRKRDSPTKKHSTTAALHGHYAKKDSTPRSLRTDKIISRPVKTMLKKKTDAGKEENRDE